MSESLPISYAQYRALVDTAIALNRQQRAVNDRFLAAVPPRNAIAEFFTVAVDIGRGVGKSRYIVERAKPDDVVLVANHALARVCFKDCKAIIVPCDGNRHPTEALLGRSRPAELTVWVDEPGLCRNLQEHLDRVCAWALPVLPTVVMLGRPPRS